MLNIDKNIPIPKSPKGPKGCSLYPFATMAIGDSFLIKDGKNSSVAIQWAQRNQPTWKFTSRRLPEGIRIWRIK